MRILFIHGRAQEGFEAEKLQIKWERAFHSSFNHAGVDEPEGYDFAFPYYGKELIKLRDQYRRDVEAGVYQMRAAETSNLNTFQAEFIEEILRNSGMSKREAVEGEDSFAQERGWENNQQVLWIARALDRRFKFVGNSSIKEKTEDVASYLIVPAVRKAINEMIIEYLTDEPTVIIAHSLGTVIAYDVLCNLDSHKYNIKGLITLGSPLGVRAVQRQLNSPLVFPEALKECWINIYDSRDIVALNPLDDRNFNVRPFIINHEIKNSSDNRHDLIPYLSDKIVAKTVLDLM